MRAPFSRRLVRLHLRDDAPSLEGLLLAGTRLRDDHYVLEDAKVVVDGETSYALTGGRARVPREKVVFVQELR